jgi:pimeloyl-ACP methyl ester carboxylesterase
VDVVTNSLPSSDGVTVALHDLGGNGDPLLVCHATGFCGRAYEPLAAELSGHFHVWAIDFRGHGDSTPPDRDEAFDWGAITNDLDIAIAAITDAPIAVFGHSLGGGISLLAERRRPGTLRWAYLFEPIVIPTLFERTSDAPDALSVGARKRRPTFPSRAAALERYAGRPPLDELRAGALAAYVAHGFADEPDGTVTLKCTPEHEALTFEASGKPTLETIGAVTTPVTIAVGTTERGWTPAMFGPAVADALPNGRLERFPTVGHFGPLQDPVTIAAAIVAASRA